MKSIFKNVLNQFYRFNENLDARIIYYHSIHHSNPRSHRIEQFRDQMNWLYVNGYKTPTLSELEEHQGDDKVVYITFDDGYEDNALNALPILNEFNFKATFFVATGYVKNKIRFKAEEGFRLYNGLRMMKASDIKNLHDNGMEIGSHGVTHRMMSKLTNSEQLYELIKSKRFLEDILSTEIYSYAYPNGQKGAVSKFANKVGIERGYQYMCTTLWNTISKNQNHILSRCEMSSKDTLQEFIDKVEGRRDYRYYIDRIVDKSKAWD